jgi:hypothetical protein
MFRHRENGRNVGLNYNKAVTVFFVGFVLDAEVQHRADNNNRRAAVHGLKPIGTYRKINQHYVQFYIPIVADLISGGSSEKA